MIQKNKTRFFFWVQKLNLFKKKKKNYILKNNLNLHNFFDFFLTKIQINTCVFFFKKLFLVNLHFIIKLRKKEKLDF